MGLEDEGNDGPSPMLLTSSWQVYHSRVMDYWVA